MVGHLAQFFGYQDTVKDSSYFDTSHFTKKFIQGYESKKGIEESKQKGHLERTF